MKRGSQRTWELVQSLYSGRSFWDRLLGKAEPPLWAFEEIAASGEAQVIPSLLSFVVSPNANVQRAAAEAIWRLFASVEGTDYVQLDDLSRSELCYESNANSTWRNLKPSEVQSLASVPHGNLLVGLATFHNSGYVRAAAVQELSSVTDGSEIPFLLVRLNDWVGEVRAEALRVITSKAKLDYARHFLRNLRLVDRLRGCGRDAHVQIIQAIESLLKTPDTLPLLKEGVASTDRWLRRHCFRLAVESKTPSSSGLLKDILSDPDPVLRLWAARNILRELSDHDLRILIPALRRDPFMAVRCEALTVLVERLPDSAEAELRDSLFDLHASVRAAARYYLQQRGIADFRTIYVNALHANVPKICSAAVAGLGETGMPNDAALLRSFLTASPVSLRKAALRSIAALDGDHYLDDLLLALTDNHMGVSTTARLALESRLSLLDVDLLWKVFADERRFHVRKNVLLLLVRLPTWTRLRFVVMACSDADPNIVEIANQRLKDWRQSSIRSTPTNRDLEMMRGLLAEYESSLDRDFVREMRFWAQR
ncbi:MAG: hypothetical protein AB9869_38330 [Verrucomicrobiia bacterium]